MKNLGKLGGGAKRLGGGGVLAKKVRKLGAAQEEPELEQVLAKELNEMQTGFMQRAKAEDTRFMDAVDSEFWIAVCFQSRAQKDAFLAALKLTQHGDKYLDGQDVAKTLGVVLPAGPKWPKTRRSAKFNALV